MRIIIGGDYVPTASNMSFFREGDPEALYGQELNKLLQESDLTVFNLEAPIVKSDSPIKKCGPNLKIPYEGVRGFAKMGVHLFSLSNNHIFDHGEDGVLTTMDALDEFGIKHIGVGRNVQEAKLPYITKLGQHTVGIYPCAEHEFSIRNYNEAGANPYMPETIGEDLENLKSQCDFTVVLYHGGKEYYRYPSPELQMRCRNMIDKGADLVLCQHSHCVGCEEIYNGKRILYGQGNFLFDNSDHESWQNGLLVSLTDHYDITYIPVTKVKNKVRLASTEEREKILGEFEKRSREIQEPGFVEDQYHRFAGAMLDDYLRNFLLPEHSLLFRIVCKLTGHRFDSYFINRRLSKKERLSWINSIECEAHRELLLTGLKDSIGD